MSANSTPTKDVLPSLVVHFGGYSNKGIKAENQDAFTAFLPDNYELETKGAVSIIADGVSSANKAKEAAQLAVTQFVSDYYSTPETWSTQKSAAKVLTSINEWMFSQSNSYSDVHYHTSANSGVNDDAQQWLTTLSALIFKSTTGYLFHVGDTRISQYRQQKLTALTRDHNRKQAGKTMVLTRAMGADNRLKVDAQQIDVQVGDIYLLTCDGVHEHISDKEFKQVLDALNGAHTSITKETLEQASRQLVDLALANGSDDNVSCLLVQIETLPVRQYSELERALLSKQVLPALNVGMKLDGYEVLKTLH